ncbi:MAG: hypothetical protein ACO2PK_14750 [Armatimonadota bacterium]
MVGADPCVCHKAISHDGKRRRLVNSDWQLTKTAASNEMTVGVAISHDRNATAAENDSDWQIAKRQPSLSLCDNLCGWQMSGKEGFADGAESAGRIDRGGLRRPLPL